MKYEKPEVALCSSAIDAVQSNEKIVLNNPDSGGVYHTNPAYESDE
jgi:hypothetical protein